MTRFTRRDFLSQQAFGLGGLAMASLMKQEGLLAAPAKPLLQRRVFDLEPRSPVYRPQATAMISMFMQGGPSHMDLCDPKPQLAKHHLKDFTGEIHFDNVIQKSRKLFAGPWKFSKHGECGMDFSELLPHAGKIADTSRVVVGDAADLPVLEAAGIENAPTVVVPTHDDDLNVYLALYCRRLRPDIQILSRCTYERNVAKLHRAGADIVLSYASMGADMVMNLLHHGSILVVAAGLDVFRRPVPPSLEGRTILESGIRERTGCSIIALESPDGMHVGPAPSVVLDASSGLLLIGSVESEQAFLDLFDR